MAAWWSYQEHTRESFNLIPKITSTALHKGGSQQLHIRWLSLVGSEQQLGSVCKRVSLSHYILIALIYVKGTVQQVIADEVKNQIKKKLGVQLSYMALVTMLLLSLYRKPGRLEDCLWKDARSTYEQQICPTYTVELTATLIIIKTCM